MMSQADFGTIDPVEESGTELAAHLNAWRDALHSLHRGSGRPSYAVGGLLWIKDSTNPWKLYLFDGSEDILMGIFDTSSNLFLPSFGALSGLVKADGSGGVAAATAADIVALIAATAVQNATHASNADTATAAGSAGSAAAIADGAVSTAAKIAANIITLAKLARTGTAGKPLLSGGPSADFYVGDFPATGVSSLNGLTGALTIAGILGYTPANGANYVGKDVGAGGIGMFVTGFAINIGGVAVGSTVAGSNIEAWDGTTNNNLGLSGTWRNIGAKTGGASNTETVFQRIA